MSTRHFTEEIDIYSQFSEAKKAKKNAKAEEVSTYRACKRKSFHLIMDFFQWVSVNAEARSFQRSVLF